MSWTAIVARRSRAIVRRSVVRIGPGFGGSGAKVDGHQGRRAVEQLEPSRVALGREPVALGVVLVGAQVVVVVEVPARELAGRDAAGHGVEEPEGAIQAGVGAAEDRVVHDLVEERRHVEEGESLEDGEGDPEERVRELPEADAAKGDDGELTSRVGEMDSGPANVQGLQLFVGNGVTEPSLEPVDGPPVVMRLHLPIITSRPGTAQVRGPLHAASSRVAHPGRRADRARKADRATIREDGGAVFRSGPYQRSCASLSYRRYSWTRRSRLP